MPTTLYIQEAPRWLLSMVCVVHLHMGGVTLLSDRSVLSDPTRSIVVIMAIFFQTELMVEICSESLGRVIGKVLLIKVS